MSKWIDADHAEFRLQCCGTYHGVIAFDTVKAVLNDAPSIDIEPKRGEWKISNLPKGKMKYCSECGFGQYIKDERTYNFCPNCGADMREREGE